MLSPIHLHYGKKDLLDEWYNPRDFYQTGWTKKLDLKMCFSLRHDTINRVALFDAMVACSLRIALDTLY